MARGFVGDQRHLSGLFRKAILHRGFALVDVISPCVTWYDIYPEVRRTVRRLEDTGYKPHDLEAAFRIAGSDAGLPIGIFDRTESKPTLQELFASSTGAAVPRAQ